MSQESSVSSESQEQPGNNPKIEDADAASAHPRDNSKPVLPWDHENKAIGIKSFSGYKVDFTGWIRRDMKQQRQRQAESNASGMKELENKCTGKKEPKERESEGKELEEEREDGPEL
ncbi:Ies4p SKDI_15G3350 [Saccharomyces kudriavzevii IFO 1802]|uniref:IES4-like protein n=2 Tax=Saccharomyces kudriavzevii (strain ATCC MYA-4449 / AS 2.2408 / CBS 8840 / NBRC 1802 / NCYC 2889) TaxID=226230 RepID=J4U2S6_SACK1|nr:uncharacterized protein SKDI_15G3350 [Saccharomyces kudriavzevii IFO 1802]EJT44295.1 IES4-like protein [Saccharomyces kudriavzevii IFO 1802]CAI4051842.1 hypothetical protein SKDI_15G3350 [Saccharomyces kudriavzevii IFO 1802]